uniref:Hypothetical conserved protein n=1 Tax=uncultured prokaryote TaxID=198431 RepID=H5SEL4_9ZZZZ|nr:hypothetical conserved protein [uncultured prokaryote]
MKMIKVSNYKHMRYDPSKTKEKILRVSIELFSEKGYTGTTTREISRRAGITEVTLFRHFPTKERLFSEAIRWSSFLPQLKGIIPELKGLPFRDALTVIGLRFLKTLRMKKDLIKIMYQELHKYPAKIHKIRDQLVNDITKTLAQYLKDAGQMKLIKMDDPQFCAAVFMGMIFSYFNSKELLMLGLYGGYRDEEVVKKLVDIFLEGISRKKVVSP